MKFFITLFGLIVSLTGYHNNLQAMKPDFYVINFYDLIRDKSVLAELKNTPDYLNAVGINHDEEQSVGLLNKEGFKKIVLSHQKYEAPITSKALETFIAKHHQNEHGVERVDQSQLICEIQLSDNCLNMNELLEHVAEFLFTLKFDNYNQISIPYVIVQITDFTFSLYRHEAYKTVQIEEISHATMNYPNCFNNLFIKHASCCTASLCACPWLYSGVVPFIVLTWVLCVIILANAN